VEAILYLESEPLEEHKLPGITGFSKEVVEKALETLEGRYRTPDCGVELIRVGGGLMISPKKEYWDQLKDRYGRKNQARLTRAARETLSIIAYSQPITRAEVESIRGVQVDSMIRYLLDQDLIREVGRKEVPGRPVQYGTTREFLLRFRIESIADLPKLEKSEAERFELEG
jgi:segregation and condensation protein B